MERQQSHYRSVLNTANLAAEDNKEKKEQASWEIPNPERVFQRNADNVFCSILGQNIVDAAEKMNFFQFCYLLEKMSGDDSDGLHQHIRFRRVKSLAFPAGEIAAVDTESSSIPSVYTTFLGLYGVDSILPEYFLNDIATGKEGSASLAEFLDIFNHRISELFYQAWKKYRYPFQFLIGGKDKTSLTLLHLIGQSLKENSKDLLQPLLDSKILGLLGVFHQRTRTADGIKSIVNYISPFSIVEVSEFQPQWINIGNDNKLSKGALKLDGGSAVVGSRFKDCNHMIHIDIAPSSYKDMEDLLPGQDLHRQLMDLLKIYLGYQTDAAIYLNMKSEWIGQTRLGGTQMLKINTGLGAAKEDKRIKIGHYTC